MSLVKKQNSTKRHSLCLVGKTDVHITMQILQKHSCDRCLEGEVLDVRAFIIERIGLGEVRLAKEVTWDLGCKDLDQGSEMGEAFQTKANECAKALG